MRVDALVIGGGMAGLAAADLLASRGRTVIVAEAGPSVGGLARAAVVGGEPVEAYYHHLFPQDRAAIALIERLGLSDRLEWRPASMGILHRGRVMPFDDVPDLLRFSALPVPARIRMGAATAVQIVRRDRRRLDAASVAVEGPRWFGRRGYDVLWRPLLESKFGPYADSVAMAWLVARIRQRAGARRATGDRLGYLRGSLGTLADAFAHDLSGRKVDMRTGTRVSSLAASGDRLDARLEGPDGVVDVSAGAVAACVSGSILGRMTVLPEPYATSIAAIPYRGIACALVELDRALGDRYWISVTDRVGLGCVGIIEHTNLVPAERYGGRHLVYLAHYVGTDEPAWSAGPMDLVRAAAPAMRAVNPAFSEDWILDVHVARDPFAQPVPLVGGPMARLPVATGLPGLFHASLAHVYPDDRGVSKAILVGRRAARAADAHISARLA
jgi:protoporphyrinogen oxidase